MRKVLITAMLVTTLFASGCNTPCFAQSKEDLQKQVKELQAQHELDQIDSALAKFETAYMQLSAQVEEQVAPLRQAVMDAVAKAKLSRGLDDTWNYDAQQHKFVKEVPKPPTRPGQTAPPAPIAHQESHGSGTNVGNVDGNVDIKSADKPVETPKK